MKINSIKVKDNKIICLVDSNQYIISSDTYAKYYLYPGKEITKEELDDIILDSNLIGAKNYLSQLLSKGSYSTFEIKRKLKEKYHLSKSNIEIIILPYLENKILDDYQYALDYIQSKNNLCYGENYLISKLIQKGISKEILQDKNIIIALEFNDQFLFDFANKFIKKLTSLPINKQKQEVFNYLTRRGFNPNKINKVIDDLNFKTDTSYLTNLNKKINMLYQKINKKTVPNNQKQNLLIKKLISLGYNYEEFKDLISNLFN